MRRMLAILLGLVLVATGALLFAWFLWWLWNREQKAIEQIEIDIKMPLPEDMPDAEGGEVLAGRAELPGEKKQSPPRAEMEGPSAAKADDLKRVEGIGPKIASVLEDAGIRTFSGLAETNVERIRAILEEEDPRLRRLADPSTWPEQAALAAAGDWDVLASLQAELKGGRRGQK
jgi:predicted flap endonuclease-1-like 5' DNA nuclease